MNKAPALRQALVIANQRKAQHIPKTQKAPEVGGYFRRTLFKVCPGSGLSSQAVTHQVLSLLTRFTSVFEMGTGGTALPCHQGVP